MMKHYKKIHATGHIEYPVGADGVVEQRNIHVSEASVTDVLMMRGEIDDEKHKRHLQHHALMQPRRRNC